MAKVDYKKFSKEGQELAKLLERAYKKGEIMDDSLGKDIEGGRISFMRQWGSIESCLKGLNSKNSLKEQIDLSEAISLKEALADLIVRSMIDYKFDLGNLTPEEEAYQIMLRKHDPADLRIEYNEKYSKLNFDITFYQDTQKIEPSALLKTVNEKIMKFIVEQQIGAVPDATGLSHEKELIMINEYRRLKLMTRFMTHKQVIECYKAVLRNLEDQEKHRGLQKIYTKVLREKFSKGKTDKEILKNDLEDDIVPTESGQEEFDLSVLDKADGEKKNILAKIRDSIDDFREKRVDR